MSPTGEEPDMTITPEATTVSTENAPLEGERADLLAELAAARHFLTYTTRGLTDEQAALQPTAGELCLGGLIKHVAAVEHSWTRFLLDDPSAQNYDLPEGVTWDDLMSGTAHTYPQWAIDRQNEFRMLPGETLADVIAHYREVAERTDEVVRTLPDLSATYPLPDAPWNEPGSAHSARRVVIHLVSETSQHAGHADIIRETIDGQKSMG
jgi:hypothetical protein